MNSPTREFLELLPPQEALQRWLSQVDILPEPERIEIRSALGRVLLEPITASQPLPAFARSTVDGYALQAADTFGASEGLPAYLRLIGETPMGAAPAFRLLRGQCALIHTGGMLPAGADAVVMVEHTQAAIPTEIEILRPCAPDENVIRVGEDVQTGEVVIPSGTILRPAEIGGLAALGCTSIQVARKPQAGILSSGDEVVPPEAVPAPGQVRDVNTSSLCALIEEAGGLAVSYGILPDQAEALFAGAEKALRECDLVIITAGSSASTRDLTAEVINRLGPPGVLVHGVNVRPGKPTILAACAPGGGKRKAVIGLPGNPVSALVIARLFVAPLLRRMQGLRAEPRQPSVTARLAVNLASAAGREDWIPVRLSVKQGAYTAEPVFGKSNLIFTLVRANGLVRIPSDATGLNAGEIVEVFLF